METYVYCTTQFEGFHRWPDATADVTYLKDLHRHIFHVRVVVKVKHGDRDIEFIRLKRLVNRDISLGFPETFSCEQIAEEIKDRLELSGNIKIHSVEVSEDGENGAILIWD